MSIRVYLLPAVIVDGTEQLFGIEFIHDALLECTEDPNERRLIMDVTVDEDAFLSDVALENYDATPEETFRYDSQVIITPLDPDVVRAKAILATSPEVITMPEMWELMRIYGRRLGITQ